MAKLGGSTVAALIALGAVAAPATLLLAAGALAKLPGTTNTFVCPVSHGHTIVNALDGRLVVLGGPPVDVRIDNIGDLRRGIVDLGLTSYPGWFALKSHFVTPPSFQAGFTVHIRALGATSVARIGGTPSQSSFTARAGPAPNDAAGWRDFVGGWTWLRAPGCYAWQITGPRVHETVVVRAEAR